MALSRAGQLRQNHLDRLKTKSICGFGLSEGFQVIDAAAIRNHPEQTSQQLQRGQSVHDMLLSRDFMLEEMELLIGRPFCKEKFTEQQKQEAEEFLKAYPKAGGMHGHCELDLSRLFKLGISGLLDEIRALEETEADPEKKDTYHSFILATEGLAGMIRNAHEAAVRALPGASTAWNADVKEIIASTGRLMSAPPQTFQDALQLCWFVWLGVSIDHTGCIALGHIDRWAYPYFKADIDTGRMTEGRALELIECLYILQNECGHTGSAYPVLLGGKNPQGQDVSNELSVLCMEAVRRTNLVYPTVGIAWNDQTPAALFDRAVELVSKGYATPAFFGDGVIQKGMKSYGVPDEQAWQYMNSTCVEITPVGSSCVWVASPYIPVCKILLEEIAAQSASQPATAFDDFYEQYLCRLGDAIASAADAQNKQREERRLHGRRPLQSVFTRDCLARGRDIDDGGAVYNWVEPSFVGLANLADALYVIQHEVFDKKNLSLAALHTILEQNFDGQEDVQTRFLQGYPKYGQGCAAVDKFVELTVKRILAECGKHKMKPDDTFLIPGAFCWVMHERLGRECGATPDGRKAGFPFADGCGPAQGRECKGPTAAILSTTSWNHAPMLGGLAMNMKFSRSLFAHPGGMEKLRQMILGFLRRDGFELQINVVDNELLHKAKENPDAYADLVVRIGGYTDYFTKLSPQMQEEVLLRYEYAEV